MVGKPDFGVESLSLIGSPLICDQTTRATGVARERDDLIV